MVNVLPLVGIMCGSPADDSHAQQIAKAARELGCDAQIRIASAHRTPEHALAVLHAFEEESTRRPVVLVTVAGRSNALSGFADPQVSVPVIACPPPSDTHGTVDVWSSLRMPAGVAPVVVLEPANAALAAAKMLGLVDVTVRDAVRAYQSKARQRVMDADAASQSGPPA
jgi:5-(carboxyamino)imidazole ribonucleotide mutase